MFLTSLTPAEFAATFSIFAVAFAARSWPMLGFAGVAVLAIGLALGFGLHMAPSILVIYSCVAGFALRVVTLVLRKATRARLAAKGLSDNARVAGRKLVLIGVFLGYPVAMLVAPFVVA